MSVYVKIESDTYLEHAVLRLDCNDLIPNQFKNSVDDRLEALQDLLVCESHVAFLDRRLGKFGLDTNIHRPFLTVVSKVGLDSVLEIHYALGIDSSGGPGAVGKLHLSDLCTKNVGKVAIKCGRTARVT